MKKPLTKMEEKILAKCINTYGDGQHPYPDHDTLPYFKPAYLMDVAGKALADGNISPERHAALEAKINGTANGNVIAA